VANRLLAATRPLDVVARLGGDEFAIIFAAGADRNTAELVAQRVLDAAQEPLRILGTDYHIGASIGLSCRDRADMAVDELIRRADMAMYTAKGRGKNCWEIFDPTTHGHRVERRSDHHHIAPT
jgi:diguanylate cyclase (GGDEF)-like protein